MSGAPLRLAPADARCLLGNYHFTRGSLADVALRLGSVQYDPLNPLGRNPDLTLQARVSGYRIDDWQRLAYDDRLLYDAWDKQACLVPTTDWPHRRHYHRRFRERWRGRIFDPHPEAVAATLAELEQRGPLETSEFTDQRSVGDWRESWYGPKLVKNVLRALWDTGEVVTYRRRNGRHIYALPDRVIAAEVLAAPTPPHEESVAFLVRRRVQSAGLLRPGADGALWHLPCDRRERIAATERLVSEGALVSVEVDGATYLSTPEAVASLDLPPAEGVRFVAPLDPLIWDRRGLETLFGFRYLWEVYKPEPKREWGYYVLPVWWRNRFVARFDSRVEGDTLQLKRWWWEDDIAHGGDPELLAALGAAFSDFLAYLGIERVGLPRSRKLVPPDVRTVLRGEA
jgi:uncharacterized protein YcaQ